MQARLTAFVPDSAAITRSLDRGERLRIGRGEDCQLVLRHPSISRVHAELMDDEGHWLLSDLQSKNGTFVEGARIGSAPLNGSCWLRFGDVHCEFAALDKHAVEADALRWRERHKSATAYTVRLDAIALDGAIEAAAGQAFLDASLRAVTELAGCNRGFMLVEERGHYRVRAALSLNLAQMVDRLFSGSRSAVARAIKQRRAVVFNDIGSDSWPGNRASVIQGALRALVCVPMLDGDRVVGAIYADRGEPGPPLTTLDLELLGAFADRTALWLTANRASNALDSFPPALADWDSVLAGTA